METVFYFGKVADFCLQKNNFATSKSIFDGIIASQSEVIISPRLLYIYIYFSPFHFFSIY